MAHTNADELPSREQALADFFEAWQPSDQQLGIELVPLQHAIGRVTAEPLRSLNTIPVVRASAMDGIAVRSTDFADGMPDTSAWRYGRDYVRADTGDDFPDEFDATIAIENVTINDDESVTLSPKLEPVHAGDNVRPAGSAVQEGVLLMKAGLPVRATDLAALAMGGVVMVPVRRKPRVAFIPTGSELVPAGITPRRGQNVDTNSLMVQQMLTEYGAEPVVFPIVYDNPQKLEDAFDRALATCDVVVLNGGSAVGSEDFNVQLMQRRGQVVHHYIAAVPGRPMMLAVCDGKPVIDLPGPTLAAYFGTQWCLQAVVARFLGTPVVQNPTVLATLDDDVRFPPVMAMIARCRVYHASDGQLMVHVFNMRGELPQCMASNAQYVSPIGQGGLQKGEQIEVELLRSLEYA